MKTIVDCIDKLAVEKIQKYKGLAIAPLIGSDSSLDYIILADALRKGLKIGESGNVPELEVDNDTGSEVLMIKGEYIIGGMQNRMVSRNIYLARDFDGKIPVKCVQAGRWHYQEPRHEPRPRRRETQRPRTPEREPEPTPVFHDTIGSKHFLYGHRAALNCAFFADSQHDVWNSVSHYLGKAGIHSSTSDLDELYEKKRDEIQKYKKRFSPIERQVGLVAILPGKKKTFVAEIFDKSQTFEKYFDTLLESYVVDAMVREGKADASEKEVRGFLSSIDNRNCRFDKRRPVSLGEDIGIGVDKIEGNALLYNNILVYMNLYTKDREHEKSNPNRDREHNPASSYHGPILGPHIPTIFGPRIPRTPMRHPFRIDDTGYHGGCFGFQARE